MLLFQLTHLWRRSRALIANQAGQAMVEYSTITFFMLVGGAATATLVPWPGQEPFLVAFVKALNIYMGSVYFWIDAPLP